MSEGIKKISNIQIARQKLINEAEAARDERNYKMLTTKMEMLRQNYKDEQDTVYKMQSELRDAERYTRETIDYKAKTVVPQLASVLTGDEQADSESIATVAKQVGIPTSALYAEVQRYKQEQEKDLPTSLGEYKAALRLGIVPKGTSYTQWKTFDSNSVGKSSSAKLITTPQAISLGSKNLIGVSQDDVINSMTSETGTFVKSPPAWFVDSLQKDAGKDLNEPELEALWAEYTSNPAVQNFIKTGKVEDESESDLLQ